MKEARVPIFLALVLLLGLPLAAAADCASGFLEPGSSLCVNTDSFVSSASASGSSDVVVKWTVTLFINGSPPDLLFSQKSTSLFQDFSSGSGQYQACAERTTNHTTGANVMICITGS